VPAVANSWTASPPRPAPLTPSIIDAHPVMNTGSTVLPTPSQSSPGTGVAGLLARLAQFSRAPSPIGSSGTSVQASGWFANPVTNTRSPSPAASTPLDPYNAPAWQAVPPASASMFTGGAASSAANMSPAPAPVGPSAGTTGDPGYPVSSSGPSAYGPGGDYPGSGDAAYLQAASDAHPAGQVVGLDWKKIALWGGLGLGGLYLVSRMMRA